MTNLPPHPSPLPQWARERTRAAFTLAEVLITLGIIGVVAAMTIPTLMANMTGNRYRAQFKKSISTLNQAVRLNKANYGWDFAGISEGCTYTTNHTPDNNMSICAIFNGSLSALNKQYMTGYYPITGTSWVYSKGSFEYFYLADGTIVGVRTAVIENCSFPVGENYSNSNQPMKFCSGFIDVNGESLPNEEVKCSVGETSFDLRSPCIVKTKDIKDVYPVLFHDSTVEPITNAGRYVLNTSK